MILGRLTSAQFTRSLVVYLMPLAAFGLAACLRWSAAFDYLLLGNSCGTL